MKKQRYSDHQANIAYVDHILEKFRLLLGKTFAEKDLLDKTLGEKAEKAYRQLSEVEKHNLWKIEHIRWCRFYFMNNWDYAEKKDKNRRKHHILMPYEELDMGYQMINEEAYLGLKDYVVNMDVFRKS